MKGYYFLQGSLIVFCGWIILYRNIVLPEYVIKILQIIVPTLIINMLFDISEKYWNLRGLFNFLGERSLEIYVLHVFVTSGIRPILKAFHAESYWLAVIIAFLLGVILPVVFSEILKRLNLWNLFFKPANYLQKVIKKAE